VTSAARPDRDLRRRERRTHLLDAAVEAIRDVGPGATMEQLARAGGVTKPILYRHFRDRDGLIAALAERFSTALLSEVEAPLLTDPAEPRRLLESTIDAYVAFIEDDPNLYRFLMRQAPEPGAGVVSISALVDSIAKQVAVVIGEQLRATGRDSGAAVPWAFGIVGLVHQAGDWWLDDRTMPRERLVAYLTDLLWNGLSTAGASPQTEQDE
jgi:AcrR family transcriptional regulator